MKKTTLKRSDYRFSHTGETKARSYHTKFTANRWRSLIWTFEQTIITSIVTKYFPQGHYRHLDFACGTGRITTLLAKSATSSIGIDISDDMLQIAKRENAGPTYICADITKNSVEFDNCFDLITAFRFFPNSQTALRNEALHQLSTLICAGGILILNNHKNSTSLVYQASRVLKGKRHHAMKHNEVRDLADSHGFTLKERLGIGYLPCADRFCWLPTTIAQPIEKLAQSARLPPYLASNNIYVMQKL